MKRASDETPSSKPLIVEVERDGDPVTGRVRDGDAERPFSGWLQLAAALGHSLRGGAEPAANRLSRDGPTVGRDTRV
jgi:hypothetical protein